MKTFVQKQFAKTKDYKNVLSAIEKTKRCPFCKENFKYHKQPILKRYKGWLATKNSWPYKGTRVHCLLIAEDHKEMFNELTATDFEAARFLTNWLVQRFKIAGGGMALRFGDPLYTGATVRHLHFQIIQPAKSRGKIRTVNFPIG